MPEPPAACRTEPKPAEPLPSLEDLTADSDLSAFLREGVPAALKNAAMRKMWSLDPAIRDYIGPSEYAWDFNQPGSMAGFGPLEREQVGRGFPVDGEPGRCPPIQEAATASEAPPAAAAVQSDKPRALGGEPVQPPDMPTRRQPANEVAVDRRTAAEETGLRNRRHASPAPPWRRLAAIRQAFLARNSYRWRGCNSP